MDNTGKEAAARWNRDEEQSRLKRSLSSELGGAKAATPEMRDNVVRTASVGEHLRKKIFELRDEADRIEALLGTTSHDVLAQEPRNLGLILDAIRWLR